MTPGVLDWTGCELEPLRGGSLKRSAIRTDGAIVTFNWFEPDYEEQPEHSHPFDQLAIIVSGTLAMRVDGVEHILTPGTALYIPANAKHNGRPIGEERVLNIDVFAPAREDYLYLALNRDDWT